jgi:hypothetical protein
MILRRLFTLTALVVAASLSLSGRANASYDVSTSISGTSGLTLLATIPTTSPAVTTTTINGAAITTTYGGAEYSDSQGSTIWLINSFSTPNLPGTSPATATENTFITFKTGDGSTWSFTDTITVVNPSGPPNGGNSNSQFNETATYMMGTNSANQTPTGSQPTLGSVTAIVINGNSFVLSNPNGSSIQYNNTSAGSVTANITSVPEPASVVMLGIGLVGVVGLGLRRMKKSD